LAPGEIEAQDAGKLIAEMTAQIRYMPQWYYYFGGPADKIAGAPTPVHEAKIFDDAG